MDFFLDYDTAEVILYKEDAMAPTLSVEKDMLYGRF